MLQYTVVLGWLFLAHGQVFYEANEEREVLSDDLDDEHVRPRSRNIGSVASCVVHVACRMLRGAS